MKKFKARQAEMWAKIRREREALQIQKDKVIDSSNKENSVIRKAESSSIYSESIKSKEASIIEKGHGKHRKTTILDFFEVNETYFLPYDFRAIEIDEIQEQPKKVWWTKILKLMMHEIKKKMMTRRWGAI